MATHIGALHPFAKLQKLEMSCESDVLAPVRRVGQTVRRGQSLPGRLRRRATIGKVVGRKVPCTLLIGMGFSEFSVGAVSEFKGGLGVPCRGGVAGASAGKALAAEEGGPSPRPLARVEAQWCDRSRLRQVGECLLGNRLQVFCDDELPQVQCVGALVWSGQSPKKAGAIQGSRRQTPPQENIESQGPGEVKGEGQGARRSARRSSGLEGRAPGCGRQAASDAVPRLVPAEKKEKKKDKKEKSKKRKAEKITLEPNDD